VQIDHKLVRAFDLHRGFSPRHSQDPLVHFCRALSIGAPLASLSPKLHSNHLVTGIVHPAIPTALCFPGSASTPYGERTHPKLVQGLPYGFNTSSALVLALEPIVRV
jgi:hypothetical protein